MSLPHEGGTWSEKARDWLQGRWPRATIHYHNGAIGGTGSGYFALCADAELPRSLDILMLDHAVNDAEQPVPSEAFSLRDRAAVYEKLLRGVLRRPGPPARPAARPTQRGFAVRGEAAAGCTRPWRGPPAPPEP